MYGKTLRFPGVFFLLGMVVLFAPSASSGQVSETGDAPILLTPASLSSGLSGLLERGHILEAEQRWSEALTHYEDALRDYPGDHRLRERLDLAKIHYNLGRRYGDHSFGKTLDSISSYDAIDLYSDVLRKIGSHYVADPSWNRLVSRGARCLDVALTYPPFREKNCLGASVEDTAMFRHNIYHLVGQNEIRSRQDAQRTVEEVATLAYRQMGIPVAAAVLEFTSGAVNGLDDYSTYLTSDQLRDVYSQIEGNFVGMGVELEACDGVLGIVHVIPHSPADLAGIKAGDRILAVDGQATSQLSTDEAASLLQGDEGSFVEITVSTPGLVPRRIRIRREYVEVPSIEDAEIVDEKYGVGYLRLLSFQKTTGRELDETLWQLHRLGMRSLILDLRGNPGGLLTVSVEVADKFIHQGGIVSTRGRSPQEDGHFRAHREGTWRVPLVVLIDGDSASASEIFAAAVRDHGRGRIVGSRSYGKGSVQGIFPLSVVDAGIRLTTARFYSPQGRPISKFGVQPHVVLHRTAKATERTTLDELTDGEDMVLAAGIREARRQVSPR